MTVFYPNAHGMLTSRHSTLLGTIGRKKVYVVAGNVWVDNEATRSARIISEYFQFRHDVRAGKHPNFKSVA